MLEKNVCSAALGWNILYVSIKSILLLSLVSIVLTITFNSLSGRLLISILFSSFSEVLSCSFNWNIFFVFLVLPNSLSVCFYVLGKSAPSAPSLEGVAFLGDALWAQRCNPAWPPESGTRGPPVWAVCSLPLWGCCSHC